MSKQYTLWSNWFVYVRTKFSCFWRSLEVGGSITLHCIASHRIASHMVCCENFLLTMCCASGCWKSPYAYSVFRLRVHAYKQIRNSKIQNSAQQSTHTESINNKPLEGTKCQLGSISPSVECWRSSRLVAIVINQVDQPFDTNRPSLPCPASIHPWPWGIMESCAVRGSFECVAGNYTCRWKHAEAVRILNKNT